MLTCSPLLLSLKHGSALVLLNSCFTQCIFIIVCPQQVYFYFMVLVESSKGVRKVQGSCIAYELTSVFKAKHQDSHALGLTHQCCKLHRHSCISMEARKLQVVGFNAASLLESVGSSFLLAGC
jgi:hypothetical protein